MGPVLANYATGSDKSGNRSRSRCCQARIRCADADEKDRHRCNRSGAPRLRLHLAEVEAQQFSEFKSWLASRPCSFNYDEYFETTLWKEILGREVPRAQQAVLVHLDGTGLPDHIYQECDLA